MYQKTTIYDELINDCPQIITDSGGIKSDNIDDFTKQQHLNYKEQINLGSYYTKPELVKIAYDLLQKHIINFNDYMIIDTSCGYGSFLNYGISNKKIGADIDKVALNNVKSNAILISHNSLMKITRKDYGLDDDKKIIVVGNPPYNDTTSIIRNNMKRKQQINQQIKTRDLGMSFLLSYNSLSADYICVLHPLSYLIKKANFNVLKDFVNNYKLIDCKIISSQEFCPTSMTYFPIIIALYEKGKMNYDFIYNYNFEVENKSFRLSQFDYIDNYITKYPNQKIVNENETVAKFYTIRDINALRRSQTFMTKTTTNTIFITADKLPYYCYVDCFKKYALPHIPYYFGNCDIMIDNKKFLKMKDNFVNDNKNVIKEYFDGLLRNMGI